jgi:hypothetical protein
MIVMPMPKGATSWATDSTNPLDAPFGGVVHRVARERDLPAVGRDLDDATSALGAKVRQGRADELDRAGQVGGDQVVDLPVGELLGGTEQAVSGVADDDVDAAKLRERAVDDLADRRRVGHIEHLGTERAAVLVQEIGDLALVPDGADDAVTTFEQLFGELAAEAAAHAGDEPGASCHGASFREARVATG